MGGNAWRFGHKEREYVEEVLSSGFASATSGNMNSRLEAAFSKAHDQNFAITFNSGTTTLHASLWALGVRYGDEVLVTPLTVISCMNAILYCNAIPVFVDIDPDTFLMCPKDMESKITSKTKAVMPVHLYGQMCDMTSIMDVAQKYHLKVLEDCAECYLASHKGVMAGTIGDIGSWSFENSKHLSCGDGGIVTTNNEELGDYLRKLNSQGFKNATAKSGKIRVSKDMFQNPSYTRHSHYGFMYRLPEVAAAVALAQVEKMEYFISKRQQMGELYQEVVDAYGTNIIKSQRVPEGDISSYWAFAATLIDDSIDWLQFRKQHVANGGDGIYAAWALLYQEGSIPEILNLQKEMGLKPMNVDQGICKNAESLQPRILQFTTNQSSVEEMKIQAEALGKTLRYFS
ncbi:DegT/DnrJ/EryC1/StrS family aminotransferase [Gammaproteobacteria bacterium]|jgi:perosamine synthetase|nr:DegT/DnrJ/EryC1/StrS family aminotransferase [Gammaproteobacteria bacterium]